MFAFVCEAVFWIWGFGGLLICGLNYHSLSGSVGVGTSTYMALGFLYWLGGTVLFGIGALLANVQRPSVTNSNTRPEGRDNPYDPNILCRIATPMIRQSHDHRIFDRHSWGSHVLR
jgi:hypothetical protein